MSLRSLAILMITFMLAMPCTDANAAKRVKNKKTPSAAPSSLALDSRGNPVLGSGAAAVVRQSTGTVVFDKNGEQQVPIASITKLMTAVVVLDARQSLSEMLTITEADVDALKGSGSRLAIGARLTREQMLKLALMSSENRAASALARNYPGGMAAFVRAMNIKASMIGLMDTHFVDSTGLNPANVSTPLDLAQLVSAAVTYPLIRAFSTTTEHNIRVGKSTLHYVNSNDLVRSAVWEVGLSKTGFIREAGRCVVMQIWIRNEPMIIVLMNASGNYIRSADARHLKQWLETSAGRGRVAAAERMGHGG